VDYEMEKFGKAYKTKEQLEKIRPEAKP